MGNRNPDILQTCVDLLLGLYKINTTEVHFTIGECMSCIADGWRSSASEDKFSYIQQHRYKYF